MEVLLEVGFEVPPFIVRHRHHHLQRPAWAAEGEQLGDLGLGEAAERTSLRRLMVGITGLARLVCSLGAWQLQRYAFHRFPGRPGRRLELSSERSGAG